MSDLPNGANAPPAAASVRPENRARTSLYRAVWRWHFYAGLLVLPFMITLAVSGGLYLFKDQIDLWAHAGLKRVEIRESAPVAPSALIAAAEAAVPGRAVKYTDPPASDISVEVTVQTPEAGKVAVYLDPYSGVVLGTLADRDTLAWKIRYFHSLKLFGDAPRKMIEIVAGWSVLLVATGVWLWWPRGQTGGVISVRGPARRRVFWRDLHAVTGICVGGFIVFLAVTGMPWSSVWGGKVNQWANGSNYGYPDGVRINVPMSGAYLDEMAKTSWSMEQARIPQSPHAAHEGHEGHEGHEADIAQGIPGRAPVGIDVAVSLFRSAGLHPGFAVSLPRDASGVYSGSAYPADQRQQRVIHLDQYTGEPLIDVSYADYGPLGRTLEWGINTHMGQTFGLMNQIVLSLACALIVLLAVSAAAMWWKRRPSGCFGVPPMPADRRMFIGLFGLLGIGGVVFPLTGLSFLVMLVLDLGWQWLRPEKGRFA